MNELKKRLTKYCKHLDFNELANDVAPFLLHQKHKEKVTLFPEYIAQTSFWSLLISRHQLMWIEAHLFMLSIDTQLTYR